MKRAVAVLVASVAFSLPITAEDAGAEGPLLCTLAQIRICTPDTECKARTPDDLGIPRFVVVDLAQKKFLAVDENRESKIDRVENGEGKSFLQGIENGRAWSAVISNGSDLTLSASSDGTAFAVFGQCVPVNALTK